jgi:hypothetical protein
MISLIIIGIVLLAATVFLFVKAVPKEGQPSRIPDKWGLPTLIPIGLLCLGTAAIVLIAKGMFP